MSLRHNRIAALAAVAAVAIVAVGACASEPGESTSMASNPEATTATVVASQTATAPARPDTPKATTTGDDRDDGAGVPIPPRPTGVPIPPRPTRDDATVDARNFQSSPGIYTFRSPSGNVWCAIRPNETEPTVQFGCQTRTSVPGPGGQTCGNNAHHTYAVRIEDRTIHFCTNQGIYTAADPRTLNYGDTIIVMGDACTSTTSGVACWRGDHGFMISRDVNLTIS